MSLYYCGFDVKKAIKELGKRLSKRDNTDISNYGKRKHFIGIVSVPWFRKKHIERESKMEEGRERG